MSVMGNVARLQETLAAGDYDPAPIIPTGIHSLDKVLRGGIPLNKMAVIAARTAHGKTATAVRLAVNMVMAERRVTVFWCEDDELEFALRSLAILSSTPLPAVLDAYRAKALGPIHKRIPGHKWDLWESLCSIERYERPTPEMIAKRIASEYQGVFILDHIGEVNWGSGFKHELIGDGLRVIRAAANKTQNLFIAMAQLNRDWDRRKAASEDPDNVRPCLSDIENSGQIEQVARVCVIAEKAMRRQNEEDIPTGEYRYHVFKPTLGVAICRWHEDLATPDNPEPVKLDPLPAVPSRAWHDVEQLAEEEEPCST